MEKTKGFQELEDALKEDQRLTERHALEMKRITDDNRRVRHYYERFDSEKTRLLTELSETFNEIKAFRNADLPVIIYERAPCNVTVYKLSKLQMDG